MAVNIHAVQILIGNRDWKYSALATFKDVDIHVSTE